MSRKGFNQAPLRCFAGDEVIRALKEVYTRVRGKHQGGFKLF